MNRTALASLVVLATLVGSVRAGVRHEVIASVDVKRRQIDGSVRITVDNDTEAPLDAVYVWLVPERYRKRPKLPEEAFYWVFPRRFNPGGMTVARSDGGSVSVEDHPAAGPGTLLRVPLATPLPVGARTRIELTFTTRVPERYGAFGCYRGECRLAGFYPMAAALTARGFDLEAPPARGDVTLELTVPRVSDVVVGGELFAVEAGGHLRRELHNVRAAFVDVGPPRLLASEARVGETRVVLLSPDGLRAPAPPARPPLGAGDPASELDRPGRLLAVGVAVVEMLDELGLKLPPGSTVTMLDGPLRRELAQPLPGVTLVSDEAFRIFPLGRFLKFHEFQLARAVLAEILERTIGGHETARDESFVPDLVASYLTDLYTLRAYRKEEYAKQILRWASFIPAVDRVLYAPQVPFASAYFNSVADPDRLRETLEDFSSLRPRGKLLYVKLRDVLGTSGMDALLRAVWRGEPIRTVAERLAKRSLDEFWTQWLERPIEVDYALGKVTSTHLPSGRWRHRITIEKRGASPPTEPVTIAVREWSGHVTTGVWSGEGRSGVVEIETAGRRQAVEIDPSEHLTEHLQKVVDDPLLNNRDPGRWRFIWNNFGGLLNFQTLTLDLSVDASLWRVHDLRNSFRFEIYSSQATTVGFASGYSRYFGPRVNAASLAGRFGLALGVGRISPSFGRAIGGMSEPGTQISLGTSVSYDDTKYVWEPQKYLYLAGSLSGVLTVLDSRRVLSQGTLSLSWNQLFPIADGHGIAVALTGAITFGDLRIARQMLALGGPGGLRGYELDELLGRGRLFSRIEYRHVFVHDLSLNLFRLLYVRGIAGGLFAEAGVVTSCSSYNVDPKAIGVSVGYSLRILADWFGVSQTVFNIDFGLPLVRHDQYCFGPLRPAAARAPVGFFVSFSPPW